MSSSTGLTDVFHKISACSLVTTKNSTEENIKEFEDLLNEAQPKTSEARGQKSMVQFMYYSNPTNFINYVNKLENKVGSIILYTESKRIAKFFSIQREVYIKWDPVENCYIVQKRDENKSKFRKENLDEDKSSDAESNDNGVGNDTEQQRPFTKSFTPRGRLNKFRNQNRSQDNDQDRTQDQSNQSEQYNQNRQFRGQYKNVRNYKNDEYNFGKGYLSRSNADKYLTKQ
jgi:hypothetical protein